jgi:hypothetical protein
LAIAIALTLVIIVINGVRYDKIGKIKVKALVVADMKQIFSVCL